MQTNLYIYDILIYLLAFDDRPYFLCHSSHTCYLSGHKLSLFVYEFYSLFKLWCIQEAGVHVICTLITAFPFSIQRHYDSVSFSFPSRMIFYMLNSCMYN
jgi:hypothetical protein